MARRLTRLGLIVWCMCVLAACNGPDHAEMAAITERTLQADAADLPGTIVTPHLQQEIPPGVNVLWCASFQLAWNEAVEYAGGKLDLDPPSPMVDALNRQAVTKDHVPEGSCVAAAGLVGDGLVKRIEDRLDATFAGQADPELLQRLRSLPPGAVAMYSYLFRGLPFEYPFERLGPGRFTEGTGPVEYDDLEGQFVDLFLLAWRTGYLGRLTQYRRQNLSIYGCVIYRPTDALCVVNFWFSSHMPSTSQHSL